MSEEFKPNSYKSRAERQQQSQQTDAPPDDIKINNVKFRKRTPIQKFTDAFIQGDADTIKKYVWEKLVIPKSKEMASSVLTTVVNMFIYGDARKSDNKRRTSHVSYRDYYDDERPESRRDRDRYSEWNRSVLDFEDPLFDTYEDADELRETLDDIISRKGEVSVAYLYQILRKSTRSVDYDWGWTNLKDTKIIYTDEGWWLKMPRPRYLK